MMKQNETEALNKDHQIYLDAFEGLDNESHVLNGFPWGDRPSLVPAEYVRGDLCPSEGCAPGVFVTADIQLINLNTCEPMSDAWADVWSCNETGVPSAMHYRTIRDRSDAGNLNSTASRGVQKSDADGVFQLSFLLHGHDAGRTIHQHIVVGESATVQPNGSLAAGGSAFHVGQLFWDRALVDEIENTTPRTTNSEGFVYGRQETEDNDPEPIYSHALFGEDVISGLPAWIVLGVDPSASYTPS